jgi:hypothetical protein
MGPWDMPTQVVSIHRTKIIARAHHGCWSSAAALSAAAAAAVAAARCFFADVEVDTLSERLAAALPAALVAARFKKPYHTLSYAASSVHELPGPAAAACLLGNGTCTVTHAAAVGGTLQLVFEVIEAAAPAHAVAAVKVQAAGAALAAVRLDDYDDAEHHQQQQQQQQQQANAVEEALQKALAAALLPGWGITSVQLEPHSQAQYQQQQQRSMQEQAVAALAAAVEGFALRPAAVGLPPATASSSISSSATLGHSGHAAADEASVAVELLLPVRSVQQLLAAGQESIRAVVLSCISGKLLMDLLLDKAWKLQEDDGERQADTSTATAAAASASRSDLAVAKSLTLQLRIIREQQQQQQQDSADIADGPAVTAAAGSPASVPARVPASVSAGDEPQQRSSASSLFECKVLSVVLMSAPAAANPSSAKGSRAAATPAAAATAASEQSEPGEGDCMLAALPLLVLPAPAQAEIQRLFRAAEAAGLPYVQVYRQMLPLLQDLELLLTVSKASSINGSCSSNGDGGNGSDSSSRGKGDGGAAAVDAADRGSRGGVGGSSRGTGDGDGDTAAAVDAAHGVWHSSKAPDGSTGGDGGSSSNSGSDSSNGGNAIDTSQLKAAAAALAAYFAANRMHECEKLAREIEQQLGL